MSVSTPLDDARYVSLRTFRRDGSAVDTPVWCAGSEGELVVFTLRDSHKVRRLQRNSRVQVARCDVRGRIEDAWHDGTCTIVDAGSERERLAYAALVRKYGWQMRIGNVFSALGGRMKRRVVLAIAVSPQPAA
jgi:PPOX class probable F420-dependent enzyme